ncbi:MAG: Serine/threonine-protein kinase PknD [Steroidobacteraceae bacterium]|nr:Serine/threonine-protein kinase PknD [Steroidobacteraceae bacterium]
MTHRILIIDDDARYGAWLTAHVGAVLPDAQVEFIDIPEFERRRASVQFRDWDVLLLAMGFGESVDDARAEGLGWLRRLRDQTQLPPIIAIASGGNELTAVRAIRLGASDYLPKHLLTPARLSTAIKIALRLVERRRSAERTRRVEPPPPPTRLPAATGAVAARARLPRNLIPRYAILDVLGESDRAVVYLATSFELDTLVALKVTRAAGSAESPDRERPGVDNDGADGGEAPAARAAPQAFAREYEVLSTIHDPSIVDIYDYGVHEGLEYLAMEYFPRGDLKARLQHPMAADEALDYVRRIARALGVVHAAGLVHRDLKPPNVMLRENDEIVLIDFGLARSMSADITTTRTGLLRGSPYYMSPEQAQGATLDARSDLYSLGVVFFEMLSGRKPYTGATAIEVLQNHVSAPIPLLPAEHAALQPLIDRLLAKLPVQRFASAGELLAALPPVDGEPVAAPRHDAAPDVATA